jgi:hypothetical protein
MNLIAIKQYLMQVKLATLNSLCGVFKTDPETMRCMLNHFIRKGCIRRCAKKTACGTSCFQCPMAKTEMEMYEWVVPQAMQMTSSIASV